MRWPFGPPHLTLKPSKKQTKKTKNKKKTNKKTQKYKKQKLSVINQFFGGGGVQKLPFLTAWPRKRAPSKHYKNRGFSLFFEKIMRHETAIFGPKKSQIQKFQLSFFACFFNNNKETPKLAETPIVIVF